MNSERVIADLNKRIEILKSHLSSKYCEGRIAAYETAISVIETEIKENPSNCNIEIPLIDYLKELYGTSVLIAEKAPSNTDNNVHKRLLRNILKQSMTDVELTELEKHIQCAINGDYDDQHD